MRPAACDCPLIALPPLLPSGRIFGYKGYLQFRYPTDLACCGAGNTPAAGCPACPALSANPLTVDGNLYSTLDALGYGQITDPNKLSSAFRQCRD